MSRRIRIVTEKTEPNKSFSVIDTDTKESLGNILFYNKYNEYCFFPEKQTFFSDEALDYIHSYLIWLNG